MTSKFIAELFTTAKIGSNPGAIVDEQIKDTW